MKHKYVTSKRKPGRPRTSIGRPKINWNKRVADATECIEQAMINLLRDLENAVKTLNGKEKP